ncbi:regulator of G-protein signaling [Acrasis kona]|uniref:Regulator of G-protein signaling n=1 Tax=Acrasis kona TaxID=1008807 RepID=A0AAW2ZMC5_9EUKA
MTNATNDAPTRRPSTFAQSAIEDPTDKSEFTDSYVFFFKFQKHDLIPLIFAVISIVLGLVAGLASYFLLQDNEMINANADLNRTILDVTNSYGTTLKHITRVVQYAGAFFNLSRTDITLYDQFQPFMYSGGSMPDYLTSISYCDFIPTNNTNSYLATMRQKGGVWSNMNATTRDSDNNVLPVGYTGPNRCLVSQIVPVSRMRGILGYDQCSDYGKNDTVNRCLNGATSVSGRSMLAQLSVKNIATFVDVATYDRVTGQVNGVITGSILMGPLTNGAVSIVSKSIIVSVFDLNATDNDPYRGFVYSTATPPPGQVVISVDASDSLIKKAPFTASGNVAYADRVHKVVIIPTDDYLVTFQSSMKIVALVLSLCFMLLLLVGCVFLYFTKKMNVAHKARVLDNFQINMLKSNQDMLRGLLERIGTQEQKTRSTINAIPDYVCVISRDGKIVQTNTAFDQEFPYTNQEMEKGVYTYSIFPELASDFFKSVGETDEINTQAARRFGDMIDVQIRVRSLEFIQEESSTTDTPNSGMLQTPSAPFGPIDSTEAFVVIAKNVSSKRSASVQQIEEKAKINEFTKNLRDPQFKEDLRSFCERERSIENVMFLDAVKDYRKANFRDRLELKQQIFNKFIKKDAPNQLNLAGDLVAEHSINIEKSLGDIDAFKKLEGHVFKQLVFDVYPRYLEHKKSSTV